MVVTAQQFQISSHLCSWIGATSPGGSHGTTVTWKMPEPRLKMGLGRISWLFNWGVALHFIMWKSTCPYATGSPPRVFHLAMVSQINEHDQGFLTYTSCKICPPGNAWFHVLHEYVRSFCIWIEGWYPDRTPICTCTLTPNWPIKISPQKCVFPNLLVITCLVGKLMVNVHLYIFRMYLMLQVHTFIFLYTHIYIYTYDVDFTPCHGHNRAIGRGSKGSRTAESLGVSTMGGFFRRRVTNIRVIVPPYL